jgi:hypothetical protein
MQNHSSTRNHSGANRPSSAAKNGNRLQAQQNYVGQVYEGAQETVSEYPLSSVLITMGLGFGAGMLLASLIAPPPRRKTYLEQAGNRVEELGHRVLDAVSGYLPRSSRW